ncbi:serine hydrolase domain-containing protein [Naumannella huperziae]
MSDPARPDADLLATVSDHADRWFAGGSAPGFAWGLFRDGKLIGTGMLGHAGADGAPPTEHTAFRIASITKSFTAATALALRDRGQLDLDAPITDLLDWLVGLDVPDGAAPPTVRMLLSMSGGLTKDDPWADRLEALGDDEFRAMINSGVRFGAWPGTRYAYSNLGYALVGQVIEAAAGRPFTAMVRELIIDPLGLDRTGFDVRMGDPIATGYARTGRQWEPQPHTAPGAFSPIGGLFSTVVDLAAWAGWLTAAWRPDRFDDDAPLSAATRREMQQIVRAYPPEPYEEHLWGKGYGYGLVIEESGRGRTVSHSGGYPGFGSHLRWDPASGLGIVGFGNARYASPARFCAEALAAVVPDAPEVVPWPETLAAADRVIAAIGAGDLGALAVDRDALSPNLVQDGTLAERQAELVSAIDFLGGLLGGEPVGAASDDPSKRSWDLPAGRGVLRCSVSMNPRSPAQLQQLVIKPVLRADL